VPNSDRIPPHLREHLAYAYAHGRLDSTRAGHPWVHITEFVRAALRERPTTLNALHQLYDAMLTAGTHTYGGTTHTTHPAPAAAPATGRARGTYMNHTDCHHPATKNARADCRHSAKMAGTWPTPAAQ
jgi:hypothetical protein